MADYEDRDQKTEEATPRRRDEAREQGQVALSSELMAALGLCVGFAVLATAGGPLVRAVSGGMVAALGALGPLGTGELSVPTAAQILRESTTSVVGALALTVIPAVVVSALAGYVQVGFQLTPKALELDPQKIDPIQGFQRLFSARAFARTGLSAAKVGLITAVVAAIAWAHVGDVVEVGTGPLGPLLAAMGHVALRCAAGALVVIVALALADLVFQRFQHGRDLRMSKQEVKEESRLTDGDPHVRARIRQIQREMATRRMMADVPKATVVVTNPTHFAVALRYEREDPERRYGAPVVVAKGADLVAQRIKRVASEAGVPLHEDVQLARALYAQVEIGQEIPEDLYAAVAAVLGYVYRLQGAAASAV